MECVESLSDSGRGRWGDYETDFALSTVRRTWRARHGSATRTITAYRMSYQLQGGDKGGREFSTDIERNEFFSASITSRRPGGLGVELLHACPDGVSQLVGDGLAGVWFVMNYLQLQFHGGIETFHVWPKVRIGRQTFVFGDAGYRDALCSFITATVTTSDVYLDDGVVIGFAEGEIALTADQIRSTELPEIVYGERIGIFGGDAPFDR